MLASPAGALQRRHRLSQETLPPGPLHGHRRHSSSGDTGSCAAIAAAAPLVCRWWGGQRIPLHSLVSTQAGSTGDGGILICRPCGAQTERGTPWVCQVVTQLHPRWAVPRLDSWSQGKGRRWGGGYTEPPRCSFLGTKPRACHPSRICALGQFGTSRAGGSGGHENRAPGKGNGWCHDRKQLSTASWWTKKDGRTSGKRRKEMQGLLVPKRAGWGPWLAKAREGITWEGTVLYPMPPPDRVAGSRKEASNWLRDLLQRETEGTRSALLHTPPLPGALTLPPGSHSCRNKQ